MADIGIGSWSPNHPRWTELLECVEGERQTDWLLITFDFHLDSHVLVALKDDAVVGFLRFVTQRIGPPDDCPPLMMNGEALIEAKILAFGVPEPYRRRGIGRQLQLAAIDRARELGCYQVRSWSLARYSANYQLKLKLGFAAQPELRANGQQGFYFVMALR
jgi:GNAT superfamily N-acetyltransferase